MEQLTAMLAFARVVETGSFSKAARDLGISKSAVSKQISRLEDRLGVRLLNRTTRRHSLTEAGTSFFEGCQRMLAEADSAEAAVSHLAAAPRGTLKVNAPMSFGIQHLGPALSDFLGAYPELSVDMVLNDRQVDLVEEGFDIGLRIGKLADSSLIARRLAPCRHVLCAAPSYLSGVPAPLLPEDLKALNCLHYSYLSDGEVWRFAGPEGIRKVSVTGRLHINNGDLLKDAAVAGLGVVLLPSFIIGEDLRAGRLVQILRDWRPAAEIAVHAVYPASRNLSPKVRVFIDFLSDCFGDPPYWDRGLFDH